MVREKALSALNQIPGSSRLLLLLAVALLGFNYLLPQLDFSRYPGLVGLFERVFSADSEISCLDCIAGAASRVVPAFAAVLIVLSSADLRLLRRALFPVHPAPAPWILRLGLLLIVVLFALWITRGEHLLFKKEGTVEAFATLLTLISALVFLMKLRCTPHQLRKWTGMLAVLFFFIAGEELSWGQRIFGWQTPDYWKALNYQGETTLHNLFNPLIRGGTYLLTLGISLLLLQLGRLRRGVADRPGLHFFLPPDGFQLFALCLLAAAVPVLSAGGELVEAVFAVIGLAYAATIGGEGNSQVLPPG